MQRPIETNKVTAGMSSGPGCNEEDDGCVARAIAEKIIIDAEQHKASIEKPSGMIELFNQEDDFFHITSHVDASLKNKIEKGEFVELNKCLYDYSKMELVSRDGATFFIPSTDKDNEINGIQRWEQAFRLYAAIYSRANPSRAAKIWQYVHTI